MEQDQAADEPAQFDRFRDSYEEELRCALSFVGSDPDVFAVVKANALLDVARSEIGDPTRLDLLDVGCGTGLTDGHLVGRVRSVTGVDVASGMLERARESNPDCRYELYDGERLPFDDGSFDVVFAICVLHHVSPDLWERFVRDMARVTRRGGIVSIAEHNPLNPVTRVIVNRCAFDDDALLLGQAQAGKLLRNSGLTVVETRNILFVPWRNSVTEKLERFLGRVPMGAQYIVSAVRA